VDCTNHNCVHGYLLIMNGEIASYPFAVEADGIRAPGSLQFGG